MEEKEGLSGSGLTVKTDEVPQSFRVEPAIDNPSKYDGSTAPPPLATPLSAGAPQSDVKKKRGRPRKYAPDGSIVALSPMPISASIPLSGDSSAWKHSGSYRKKHKLESKSPGGTMPSSVGGSFTPHVFTVNAGEDVNMKIISFSQQGSRAICILAANGSISNVTLRQSNSFGGTLTYEGRFEILSLTGSFIPSDNGLTKSRSGGMSVSLAGSDGRVLGGGLAGMLVAAGPVQVVIGSFLPGHQQEQKPKKRKYERTIAFSPITENPISEQKYEGAYGGAKPILTSSVSFHGDSPITEQRYEEAAYGGAKPILTSSASFHGDKIASVNSIHGFKTTDHKNNISFSGEDSREPSHEMTC